VPRIKVPTCEYSALHAPSNGFAQATSADELQAKAHQVVLLVRQAKARQAGQESSAVAGPLEVDALAGGVGGEQDQLPESGAAFSPLPSWHAAPRCSFRPRVVLAPS